MKRYVAMLLAVAMLLMSGAAFADVTVENDQISAYMDGDGGIILTGYSERINATDAYELVSIDAGRVTYLVEGENGALDLVCADFTTQTETTLYNGVKLACGYDGNGIYIVANDAPSAVRYVRFDGGVQLIYNDDMEDIAYLQQSYRGLVIGFEDDAGAMLYSGGEVAEFNGRYGVERRIMDGCDLVLTEAGELYLDDPTALLPAKVAGNVEQFETINGYIYYISNDGRRELIQYSPDTMSWQSVAMYSGRLPVSLTASYSQALVMDDSGVVYSVDDANCALTPYISVSIPSDVDINDVFIAAVSGQMNVYSEQADETEYVVAFSFGIQSDSDTMSDKLGGGQDTVITLLASAEIENEITTFDVLTPAKQYDTLSYGSRGDGVTQLQQKLYDLGYHNDKVDGIFGPRTRYSVMLFQDFNGLEVTGVADRQMQEMLFGKDELRYDPYRQISYGARGMRVTEMQERLRALDYMADPADGIYGPYTRAGVMLFQEENGLNVNGVADTATLRKLYDYSTPRCVSYYELNYGDSGSRVLKMNRRLKELYYLEGSVGSYYSQETKNAVKKFQSEIGYYQNGVASEELQQRLYAASAPEYSGLITLQRGDENSRVYDLQKRLRSLGYFEGTCTGYFGKVTYNAVKNFQRMAGLSVTGVATIETQRRLYSNDAPKMPSVAQIGTPVITLSHVLEDLGNGYYKVDDKIIKVNWYTKGKVDDYYVEIRDQGGRIISSGFTDATSIELDIRLFDEGRTYSVTVHAIPKGGNITHAKHATAYIIVPYHEVEVTKEPRPTAQITEAPTPEVTAEPTPEIKVPVVNAGGDFTLEGNVRVVGKNGADFHWVGAENTEYSAALLDGEGNKVHDFGTVPSCSVNVTYAMLSSDEVYTLNVTAYAAGGNPDTGKSVQIQLRAAEDIPEPEPTEENVSITVNVTGADQINGIWYLGDAPATISWTATGNVVKYSIAVIDPADGSVIFEQDTDATGMTVGSGDFGIAENEVGFRVTAYGETTSDDETVYLAVLPTEETTAEPTEEPEAEPAAELTPEPTAEPTPEPTAEPTEEPTPKPVPEVIVMMDGSEFGDGEVYEFLPKESIEFTWSNTGDATEYSLYIINPDGSEVQAIDHTTETQSPLNIGGIEMGDTYGVRIVAHTSGGDIGKAVYFTLADEGQAYTRLAAPVLVVGNYDRFEEGVYYDADTVTVDWGSFESEAAFNVYLTDEDGNILNSEIGTTLTRIDPLDLTNYEDGTVLVLTVIAVPEGADESTGSMATAVFCKESAQPGPETVTDTPAETEAPVETEVPAETEAPVETEAPAESEAPAETEAPAVGTPVIYVTGGLDKDGVVYYENEGGLLIEWYAEGDLDHYNLYLCEGEQVVSQALNVDYQHFNPSALPAGIVYTIKVEAVPAGGSDGYGEFAAVSVCYAPEAEVTPEPTPEPVAEPEPTPGVVSVPVFSPAGECEITDVSGYECYVFGSDDFAVAWSVEGDVEYYNLALIEDSTGNTVSAVNEVYAESVIVGSYMNAGAYYWLSVEAAPVNGGVSQTGYILLMKEAVAEPTPEPEATPEPYYEEPEQDQSEDTVVFPVDVPLTVASDPMFIYMYQQKLVEWGWLQFAEQYDPEDPVSVQIPVGEPGILDQGTAMATRQMQEHINLWITENNPAAPFRVRISVDPITEPVGETEFVDYVGTDTLEVIMREDGMFFEVFRNPLVYPVY